MVIPAPAVCRLGFGDVAVKQQHADVQRKDKGVLRVDFPVEIVDGSLGSDIFVETHPRLVHNRPPRCYVDGDIEVEISQPVLHPIHITCHGHCLSVHGFCPVVIVKTVVAPHVREGKIVFLRQLVSNANMGALDGSQIWISHI